MKSAVLRRAAARILRSDAPSVHVLRSEGGFTMVELMIVVVVIGIIAAAVGFTSTGLIGNSVVGNMKGDLKAAHPAAVEHFTSFNQFPTALVASSAAPTAANMPFEASEGNAIAIAPGSSTTLLTLRVTHPKKPGFACSITIRPSGTAKPVCA